MDDDDDDVPQLSASTLAALQQFHVEKDARQKQFEELKSQAEDEFQHGQISMDSFGEDWNASQFWYTDDTARILARQLLTNVTTDSAIAVVSAPSVYVAIRNILAEEEFQPRPVLRLLEFDQRFKVFGSDFVSYDFNQPLRLPIELKGKFDRIIADPPFLSDDCQTRTALSVRYLSKGWTEGSLRFISCTGERMHPTVAKLYGKLGVQTTTFEPQHSKGLSNEFRCYANFQCETWTWQGVQLQ